ncbi:hypothetical protein ACHAW5_010694 [Stephanodiscus triporus]|uniref:Uncharacterized protein n=1 Tax=Stephanodiscus triporus TaxID=2934178 RepID=A0ABD3NN09_9STRA
MVSAARLATTIALAAAAAVVPAIAFVGNDVGGGRAIRPTGVVVVGPLSAASGSADDDSAARAMSEYMAKSHEEKLRAIKAVEDKKNSEIEKKTDDDDDDVGDDGALKAEIDRLKTSSALAVVASSSSSPAPAAPLVVAAVDTSDIQSKLASYQNFMANYIVNAQNQKLLAVKEAELKAEKKFHERLERLMSSSGMTLPAAAADGGTAAAGGGTPFQERNARIVSAAKAGKSRWGSMEIDRAASGLLAGIAEAPAHPRPPPAAVVVASAASTPFERRNARVLAAASVGKSRWGTMEIERMMRNGVVASPAVATTTPAPAVEDKSRISLEDRLNLGARLLGAAAVASSIPPPASTPFERRKAHVLAAASVGKSRWGTMEIERMMRNGVVASLAVATTTPAPAVEEKSHVSIEDRVNLGARLLSV